MSTVSTRIPEKLKKEFEKFRKEEKLDKSVALRQLMSEGLEEWKKKRALRLLSQGKITVSKGAKMADMDLWDFVELIKQKKITWIKDDRVKEDLEVS